MHVNSKLSECEWGEPTLSALFVVLHKVDTCCIVLVNLLQSCATFFCAFPDNCYIVYIHCSVCPILLVPSIAIPISCESRSTCFSSVYCS